jgi:hypothetical protein
MSFGASKPFSFGTPAQQSAPTSIFGNTSTPQQPQTTSIFGAKQPTQTTLSFTSTGAFGINKPTSTVSPFGQTQPQQQQQQTTSLLGGSTSGFGLNKPATPSFSFGPASTTATTTNPVTTGLGGFGSQLQQQAKPAFSAFGQTTAGPSLSIFGTQTQPQQQQQQQPATQSFFSSTQSFQQPQQTSFAGLGSFQQQQAPTTSLLNNNQSALINQTMVEFFFSNLTFNYLPFRTILERLIPLILQIVLL